MQILEQLLLVTIAILIYFILVQAANLLTLKKLGRFPDSKVSPFVSVLIPARNEAANIERCVQSLLEQAYPNYEVIVIDDESEDGTGAILDRMALQDKRLRVLKGEPLPEGWVGKSWACQQIAGLARGDYLLFVDADTRHHPSMLRAAVDAAVFFGADLLTAMPGEKAKTLSEAMTIPLVTWGTFSALALPLAFKLRWPALSITIGQFLLFSSEAYRLIGGHASVANHVAEDMQLGRTVKSKGLRWRLVDGSEVVECRMYTNFGEAVNGLSKSIFGALNYRILLVFFFSMLLGLMFFLPPLLIVTALAGFSFSRLVITRAAVAVILALLSWGTANLRFRMPWYATVLYPAISVLTIYIFFHSMVLSMQGKTRWKGRVLGERKFRI